MWTKPLSPQPGGKTLLILGEAPGAQEESENTPFVGASGRLLTGLLANAGLDRAHFHLTNVFQLRPQDNKLDLHWTANKTEHKKLGLIPRGAPLQKRYLLPDYWPQVEATRQRLLELQPDLVIGVGAKAQWLLTGDDRIGTFRGTFFNVPWLNCPALTTFHPAAVLREYKMLPVVLMDLIKVRLFLTGELQQPLRRRLYINPTWDEIELVYHQLRATREPLGVDIETCPSIGQITTISFSTPTLGICIPLWDKDAVGVEPSVYSPRDEVRAWRWIDRYAALPNTKILQNGLYDMQYLLDAPLPIRLRGKIEDTAIMQHAYQPELRKDLGSLASFYLNEPSWKQMRTSAKDAKADE